MANNEKHYLMLCGLGDRDRMLVSSAARISAIRANKYEIQEPDDNEAPDIYLVDDSSKGWRNWKTLVEKYNNQDAPVLLLRNGDEQKPPQAPKYQIFKRPLAATRLLKVLDEMCVAFLDSGVEISDDVSFGEITAIGGQTCILPGEGKRVLVVDDSESVRKLMEVKLSAKGIRADFAEDGETALSMARKNDYALVFLDVMLPGIDGYEVCRHLKKDLEIKGKVLMLTSRSSRMDRLRGSLSTADGYLTKPLSGEALKKALDENLVL
jgi:twitching motility two-component system response regulator PilG